MNAHHSQMAAAADLPVAPQTPPARWGDVRARAAADRTPPAPGRAR